MNWKYFIPLVGAYFYFKDIYAMENLIEVDFVNFFGIAVLHGIYLAGLIIIFVG